MRILILFLALTACVTSPTKVSERQKREFDLVVDKSVRPLEISEQTVILDTRSSFDYGLNHVANSLHFPWDQLAESARDGEVLRDPRKAALKLSLIGLQPMTPVVVVGNGPRAGQGEEGRLAWTLLYLGFQDVQTAQIESFRSNMTPNPSAQPQNVSIWKVTPRSEMQIGKPEFSQLSQNPRGRLESRIWIIDVRSDKEYFNKSGSAYTPDIHALHMEWKEFYTDKGRPNPTVRAKLESLGVRPSDRVILVSNKGVRSGAAAYALIALGFSQVQNFTAGWNSLH